MSKNNCSPVPHAEPPNPHPPSFVIDDGRKIARNCWKIFIDVLLVDALRAVSSRQNDNSKSAVHDIDNSSPNAKILAEDPRIVVRRLQVHKIVSKATGAPLNKSKNMVGDVVVV